MLKMKSSRATTLKGRANQIIKQIVKVVLPSDVVQLQAGRKKKPKKAKKTKGVKAAQVPRAPRPPPSLGGLPKAPEGFLSHNIRPEYPSVFGANPPRQFAQPSFQPPAPTPKETPFEKMFFEQLVQFKSKQTPKETPEAPVVPSIPSMSLDDVFKKGRIPRGVPPNAPFPPSRKAPFSAPNQANQPSIDVTPEGKEEMKLRPQAPASTFVKPNVMPSPGLPSSSSSAATAAVFQDSDEYRDEYSDDEYSGIREELKKKHREYEAHLNAKPKTRSKKTMDKWEDTKLQIEREIARLESLLPGPQDFPGEFAEIVNEEEFPEIVNEED